MLPLLDLRAPAGAAAPPLIERDLRAALAPPAGADDAPLAAVRAIIARVRDGGDAAVRATTRELDGCDLADPAVPAAELDAALASLPAELRAALEFARDQIEAYHRTQVGPAVDGEVGRHERSGVVVRDLVRPVDRVGCYVPGGRAAYPSTVLMTVVPARVAGVREVVLCVPPDREGRVPAITLAAAALAGVDTVYRIGGAQAVAALAHGTETIDPVDVIVGPGNVYVALAKREVAGIVGIEATAGPSEVVVVADASVPPAWVAVDLVAQAEHGPGGSAVLVTWEPDVARAVEAEVAALAETSPRRAEVESTLRTGGRVVLVDGPEQAIDVANAIAPEHLQLMVADPEPLAERVRHAGAVFCGPWSPASVGDYVAGTNHVLPTGRTARFTSALRVDDFRRHVHVVALDEAALRGVAPHVAALAAAEGLDAHAATVLLRAEGAQAPAAPVEAGR
jgi:histidinol dehydrogenase